MSSTRVLVFQHIACEDLGSFAEVLAAQSVQPDYVRLYAGEPLPADTRDAMALMFLGGPMSVNEEARYPYLGAEKLLIQTALARGTPILGVCLGAQLLAAAAGSRVFAGARPEIGWAPVSLTVEGRHDPVLGAVAALPAVFHWHGETFDLPSGATRLAFSGLTMNQAFRLGERAYGLQFHLEVTPAMIDTWVATYRNDLGTDPESAARRIVAESDQFAPSLRVAAGVALERFLAQARRSSL